MADLSDYWKLVARLDDHDQVLCISTYERSLPHGVLVLTITESGNSVGGPVTSSLVFVPAAPHPGQGRL